MKLSYKMFGAFLLVSFISIALMAAIMRFSISRDFADYVNKVEIEKLDGIVHALAEMYEDYGGWAALRNDPDLWGEILRAERQASIEERSAPLRGKNDFDGAGARHRSHGFEKETTGATGERLQPRRLRRRLPPSNPVLRPSMLSLFDAQKRHVAGRLSVAPSGEHALREISVDGEIVGWLALRKREQLTSPMDIGFLKHQSQVFLLTAGGVLLLAAIVSLLLSKHFLAPIRQLTAGTRALTSLKFGTRIKVRTRDELGQLAVDFNVMARTIENYEQLRKQWVSDIAHELRTPLSILRGEIEAMQDGVRVVSNQTLDSLHSETLHISKIVDDLRELSMADAGALHLSRKPVSPLGVLRRTLSLFQARLTQMQITVREELGADRDLTILGDADRLAQLYSNLLENTLRYTDRAGTLRIWQERTQNNLMLNFEDSGPGVPEEAVGRLFDRLYRVDASRTRARGGCGLGLTICKTIAEAHGGKMSAANAPSGGLRIELQLPIASNSNS